MSTSRYGLKTAEQIINEDPDIIREGQIFLMCSLTQERSETCLDRNVSCP